MVRAKLFRPFPRRQLMEAIGSARRVGVLDRNHSAGSGGIFWQEVAATLQKLPNVIVQDYVIGLGGGDVTPHMIDRVIDDLVGQTAAVEPIWQEVVA
jgi:pyruvate/2-oxoacid:ferredoxin oxidoreductase alpha subunit